MQCRSPITSSVRPLASALAGILLLAPIFANAQTNNAAFGTQALSSNTTGFNNIADGVYALFYNTTGSYNSALGVGALMNNTTGSGNIAMGYYAAQNLTTDNNNIDIGNYVGQAGDNGVIRIGTTGTNMAI